MNEKLELKTVNELIEIKHFYIPSYQRGYRWDNKQVIDLLDDIYEFANSSRTKDEFYCLQPIVTTKFNESYKVIDGQQRLTTIYIILKYLKESNKKFQEIKNKDEYKEIFEFCDIEDFSVPVPYDISYQTRENDYTNSKDFLENINLYIADEELCKKNPDFYYISQAYKTIKKWFTSKSKKQFINILLDHVKVIWYEISNNSMSTNIQNEIKIFNRLNIGKIPLTNSELIKAILLIPIINYKEQIEFSTIWDNIEQNLQNNNFWYFLTNKKKGDTSIDLIFKLLAEKYYHQYIKNFSELNLKEYDDKFSYYIFDKLLKDKILTTLNLWSEVKEFYRYFLDWYNNNEIYHKIGYLIYFRTQLLSLINMYIGKTKSEFIDLLNKLIKASLSNVDLQTLNYQEDKVLIKKTLLIFNIETILNNKTNTRFLFNEFKNDLTWDIEHIAPQTENMNKEEWIKTFFKYIHGIENINKNRLDFIIRNFERFYIKKKEKLEKNELKHEYKHNIGNLTLLDSRTNRSYGNAFFPIKRAIILENDSKALFIPISTKNVFLKQYSNKLLNMMSWTNEDVVNYRTSIYSLLKKYGVQNGETR